MAWRPLGPSCVYNGQLGVGRTGRGPVSGRVTSLVLDPSDPDNIIYVGTASGGVWRSQDAGQSWDPQMDDKLSMAIGELAINPTAPHRLYVASGEGNDGGMVFYGTGLQVFDPAANTWTLRMDASADLALTNVQCGALVVTDTRILAGNTKGLFESIDDGITWSRVPVTAAGNPNRRVRSALLDIDTDPARPRLYVALHEDGIYRKVGGDAWEQLPRTGPGALPNAGSIRRAAIDNCHTKPLVLYAVFGDRNGGLFGIYRSPDGGDTWERIQSPTEPFLQSNYNLVIAVHPTNENTVLLGATRLWRSTNGGQNWTMVSDPHGSTQGIHADQHALVFHPTQPNKMWLGNDGGVWYSEDGGETWHPRNRGLATMQYYTIAQHPVHETLLLVGSQDNGTQRFEGNPAWNLVNWGDGFFCAIDHQQPRFWYSSYVFGLNPVSGELDGISRSDKAGAEGSWRIITRGISTGDTVRKPFYVPFVVDTSQTNVLYLGTSKLYRTEDRGDNWDPIETSLGSDFSTGANRRNVITAIAVNPQDSEHVYVGAFDGQFYSLERQPDGTWNAQPRPPAAIGTDYHIADIAVPRTPGGQPASDEVYASIGSAHLPWTPDVLLPNGRIFYSPDRGQTWHDRGSAQLDLVIQGEPVLHRNNPVNAIVIDPMPPHRVYIGCNMGVFFTDDQGVNWTQFRDGLPNVPIADLQFDATRRLLRAATIGRGVWEIPVDAPPAAADVKLVLRDNIVDSGVLSTAATLDHPLRIGEQATWVDSLDIKVDTPFPFLGDFQTPESTVEYNAGGAPDFIAFQAFSTDDLRDSKTSRVYLHVQNRGPGDADAVSARIFAAHESAGAFPTLQANFWTIWTDPDAAKFTGDWKPIGAAQNILRIPATEPAIVQWDWETPPDLESPVGLLAIVSAAADPVTASAILNVEQVVRNHRHVALKRVEVGAADSAYAVLGILLVVGVAVGVGLAVSELT